MEGWARGAGSDAVGPGNRAKTGERGGGATYREYWTCSDEEEAKKAREPDRISMHCQQLIVAEYSIWFDAEAVVLRSCLHFEIGWRGFVARNKQACESACLAG